MKSIRNFTSLGDLILAQVDVAVVLRELAHARQSRQRAGQLVPVQHVEGDVAEAAARGTTAASCRNTDDATGSSWA